MKKRNCAAVNTVFSSQIWTMRSKPAPLTFDRGERAAWVASVAAIWVVAGSIVDSAGLVVEVMARAKFAPARANARTEEEYMLMLVKLNLDQLILKKVEEQKRSSFNPPISS